MLKILRDILNIPKTRLEPTEPKDTGSVNLTTAVRGFQHYTEFLKGCKSSGGYHSQISGSEPRRVR